MEQGGKYSALVERHLNEKEKDFCDKDISEEEVFDAIMKLKHDKSPGIDGLTPEFYQVYWPLLKNPFMSMIYECYANKRLPTTLNQAVLTLIFKKGERHLLKNYRPISITNYDYKILAFVLARRLQDVIKNLVHSDQSGYIKGRFIGINVRYIIDFYKYC
jgi:hypothetical protein